MIQERIESVRCRITGAAQRAGRNPAEITLIAVSKTFGRGAMEDALKAGVVDFGENYIQELLEKQGILKSEGVRWHFVGHLQSNKVRYIADWIHLIHSVDSLRLAREISRSAEMSGRTIPILVEVNTTGEASKFGCPPAGAPGLIREMSVMPSIRIDGLMTMGPFSDDPEDSRPAFRTLRELAENLRSEGHPLPHLSMGMTGDFEVAIEEGATLVRVGTAIFGSRTVRKT